MKKFLSIISIAFCFVISANAQSPWVVTSCWDLETNTSFPPGYTNVIITNNLGVGMNCASGYTPLSDPLTVNSPGPGLASSILLLDVLDNSNRIIHGATISQALSICANNKPFDGASMSLYGVSASVNMPGYPSPNYVHATVTYPNHSSAGLHSYPGMVQTVSYQGAIPSPVGIGLQHVVIGDPLSPQPFMDVFHVSNMGDMQIAGNMYLANPLERMNGTAYDRNISAVSDLHGMNIYTNSDNTNGTAIEMFGAHEFDPAYPLVDNSGEIQMTTYTDANPTNPIAYNFQVHDANPPSYNHILVMNKNGNSRFCSDINNFPTASERLTVDGDMYLWTNPAAVGYGRQRNIFGRSSVGGLNLVANSDYTNGSDGPVLSLFGNSSSTSPVGAVQITSSGANIGSNGGSIGLLYRNYDPGLGGNKTMFIASKGGQGIFGYDVQLSNIANSDVFTIKNSLGFYETSDATTRSIHGNTNTGEFAISAKTGSTDGPSIEMYGNNYTSIPDRKGRIHFVSYGNTGSSIAYEFYNYDPSTGNYNLSMGIDRNQKVFIGEESMARPTGSPTDYRLYVADGILTEKIRVAVKTTPDWADYVFAKNYKLKSLQEVENYIDKNKHLPDVPAAEELVKSGIDMVQMDAKLMQKIEELTLYVIQQQKQIDELQKKLGDINAKN